MKKSILCFVLVSSSLFAKAPDPKAWFSELESNAKVERLLNRYLIFDNSGKQFDNWKSGPLIAPLGPEYGDYLRQYHPALKLSDKKAVMTELLKLLPIDRLIMVDGKTMNLYYPVGTDLGHRETESDLAQVSGGLKDVYNYGGIVLARKKNFILVAGFDKFAKNTQGLLLAGTQDQEFLPKKPPVGSAILQLVKSRGSLGVFEILVSESPDSKIALGTKVAFGTGK